ncbi:MAG TPA: DUF1028 domain-containing protein [Frankiaceae bacterium]|nr:DUF1028 domain-containing protein [Frankiaceae bacterium]
MTFSIVGRDGGQWGVAVASKFLAVGAFVPAARAGAGALATQAMANLSYRGTGLALLAEGREAAAVVDALVSHDDDRGHRQLGVVDREGNAATYTGAECHPWCGGRTGEDYAIQGNILVGPEVVEEAERAFLRSTGPLAHRLLAALEAGDAAGGDKRGRQAAALLVVEEGAGYGGFTDVIVDLRCDDSAAPIPEVRRLLELHEVYFGRPDPKTLLSMDDVRAEVSGHLARLGYDVSDFDKAYDAWIGTENYEERHVPGKIDTVVLERMRSQER